MPTASTSKSLDFETGCVADEYLQDDMRTESRIGKNCPPMPSIIQEI